MSPLNCILRLILFNKRLKKTQKNNIYKQCVFYHLIFNNILYFVTKLLQKCYNVFFFMFVTIVTWLVPKL